MHESWINQGSYIKFGEVSKNRMIKVAVIL